MRIGLLAWEAGEYESNELYRYGREQGHEMTLFTLPDIGLRLSSSGAEVTVLGESAHDRFDLVLARPELRPGLVEADYELLHLLGTIPGVTVIDPPAVYLANEFKLVTLRRLADAGFPVVPTRTCRTREEVADAAAEWGRIVLKPTFTWGGKDVERVFDVDRDAPVVERLLAGYEVLACQPYIEHPGGDIRVTVVGDEVPLTFRRVPSGGENWKANVALGADAEVIQPPPELAEMALEAARLCRITMAGLDFLDTADGYRILEINDVPGWYPVPRREQQATLESVFRMFEARMRARVPEPVPLPRAS
ncbi:RimK family alpha-L-glutamate ligase [Amycolatopsis sp. cmx-4-68]|uniref:ATP-grasp domain-containing protein n=1 Tax=Amycolatopsis sp. cmx-4-68 TaxID=2790938 RepID=UPI003979D785